MLSLHVLEPTPCQPLLNHPFFPRRNRSLASTATGEPKNRGFSRDDQMDFNVGGNREMP
jgi:hypothetical protein